MKIEDQIIIGEALRDARLNKGFTLEEVAAHLGVTHKSVQFWEQGRNKITLPSFISLCKLYNISPNSVLDKVM